MHRTALVFRFRKDLAHSLQHPLALVADNELHAVQTAALEPLEKADPAGLVLLHAPVSYTHLITVVSFGKKIAEGTPKEISNNELVIKAYLGDRYKA